MATYATAAQLLERYDARDIGDLVSDTGDQASPIDLLSHPLMTTVLEDASGAVEAALLVGNRYTTDQLEDLTGNSASYLERLVCDIAMSYLLARRPGFDPDRMKSQYEMSEMHLERMRAGENVLNLVDQKDAGNPSIDGPTLIRFQYHLNMVRDRVLNYYPRRRLPGDR